MAVCHLDVAVGGVGWRVVIELEGNGASGRGVGSAWYGRRTWLMVCRGRKGRGTPCGLARRTGRFWSGQGGCWGGGVRVGGFERKLRRRD